MLPCHFIDSFSIVATENVIPTENVIHYIFGYYILGYDRPTENVITENVISPIIKKSCIVLKGGSNRGGRKWGKYCYFVVYCNFVYFVRNILCSDSNSNSQVEKLNPMHFLIARQLDQLSLNEGMSVPLEKSLPHTRYVKSADI